MHLLCCESQNKIIQGVWKINNKQYYNFYTLERLFNIYFKNMAQHYKGKKLLQGKEQ